MRNALAQIDWAAPAWLWGLLAVPVVAVALYLAGRRRSGGASRYADPALMGPRLAGPRRPGRVVAAALAALALAAGTLAMARPTKLVNEKQSRGTVMLVIDVSDSMKKTDLQPTRLAVARDAARRFIESAPKDVRIGLVAMAGSVDVVASPTTDRARLLESLRTRFTSTRYGTVIGDSLAASVQSLRASGALTPPPATSADSAGRILLITDGAQVGDGLTPDQGAQIAAAARVPVYTIMIGNDPGLPNQATPPDTLGAIASTTGGVFAQTATADDLRRVFADMGRVLAPDPKTVDYAWVPAAAALGLLLLAGAALVVIPATGRRRSPATA